MTSSAVRMRCSAVSAASSKATCITHNSTTTRTSSNDILNDSAGLHRKIGSTLFSLSDTVSDLTEFSKMSTVADCGCGSATRGSSLSKWQQLQLALSQDLSSASFEEAHMYLSDLQTTLDGQLSSNAMLQLLIDIVTVFASPSGQQLAIQSIFSVFNCHRKIQNIFQYAPEKMGSLYFPNPYLKLVADCVVQCFSAPELIALGGGKCIGQLLDHVQGEARRAVAFSLFFSSSCSSEGAGAVTRHLSQNILLEFLVLVLH